MKYQFLGLVLVFCISLIFSLVLTPMVAKGLIRLGLVDKPSPRRINKTPVPRGGGIALIISYTIAVSMSLVIFNMPNIMGVASPSSRLMLVYATLVLIFVGIMDDIFNIKPFIKLLGQLLSAFLVYTAGLNLGACLPWDVPEWLNILLTLGWFATIVNAFNLIDGLDGLSAGLAFIGSLGLFVCFIMRREFVGAIPLAALMGASLGFLRYNFNPASVFLGDTGAMFLGYVLALIPLNYGGKTALISSLGVPLLVMGVPLFDTVLAVWRRSLKAQLAPEGGLKQVFLPDMEHLHHRLLSSGLSQRKVAWFLYLIAIILVGMAVSISWSGSRSVGIVLIGALVIFAILSKHLLRVELWYTGTALRMSFQSKFKRLLVPIYIAGDIIITFAAWYFAADLSIIPHVKLRGLYYTQVFPVFFISIFAMLYLFQIYHRIWSKAVVRDYVILVSAVVIGWIVGYSVISSFFFKYPGFWRHSTTFLFLIVPFMLASRIVRMTISSFLSLSEGSKIKSEAGTNRIIVYGAGERFMMFDTLKSGSVLGHCNYYVMGVIDDDPLKAQRFFHGYRIYGGCEKLEKLISSSKLKINSILLCADLQKERLDFVLNLAKRYNLSVDKFDHSISSIQKKDVN